MHKIHTFLLLLVLSGQSVAQQDYDWWNKKHNWNGYTAWEKYYTISPRYFGPNALPVPELKDGKIPERSEVGASYRFHKTTGDRTHDLFTRIEVPFGKRISLEGYVVALESYQMDTLLRDERAARDRNPQGLIGGDIYLATSVGLIQDHRKLPNTTLRIGLRTASGLHFHNARYTDTPGYFTDLTMGKVLVQGEKFNLTAKGMIGFYAWQTNLTNHRQNDAVLYGLGLNAGYGKIILNADLSGYSGYLNNGDQPLVWRNEFGFESESYKLTALLRTGYRDWLYNSYGVSFSWYFPGVKN